MGTKSGLNVLSQEEIDLISKGVEVGDFTAFVDANTLLATIAALNSRVKDLEQVIGEAPKRPYAAIGRTLTLLRRWKSTANQVDGSVAMGENDIGKLIATLEGRNDR